MKLFQRLLVAPAALGLLAPMTANANEVNFNAISNYTDVENLEFANSFDDTFDNNVEFEPLIAGGEGMVPDYDTDSFSETTTASFSLDMGIGAVDGQGVTTAVTDGNEAITATYGFQIDLNTSFTGEDSLDISLDAGNGLLGELDLNTGSEALTVDGISYTFPVGDKTTVFVGDNTDGSALYSTACVYGGPTNTLDDCGNVNSALGSGNGTAAGASFDIGNGFTAAVGYTGEGSSQKGLLSKESADAFGGQLTYTADSYGLSATYANIESNTSTSNSTALADSDVTYWALNGYWTPSESGSMPSISVGYETGDSEAASTKDTSTFFVGLQWDEVGPGTFGAAMGTTGHISDGETEYYMYEAFYSYPVNDGMTITPVVYVKELASPSMDETGVMVKTSFSF